MRTGRTVVLVVSAVLLALAGAGSVAGAQNSDVAAPRGTVARVTQGTPAAVPQWFLDRIVHQTAGGGRWFADNTEHAEEDGGIVSYEVRWSAGIGGKSMVGVLSGIREDGTAVGPFWEYRVYWHPGEREVRILQWGPTGALGEGVMLPPSPDQPDLERLEQIAYTPAGGQFEIGHETTIRDDELDSLQLRRVAGEWQAGRRFVWRRRGS